MTKFEHAADGEAFSLSINVYGQPDTRLMMLSNPDRIALDLTDTVSSVSAPDIAANALVSTIRDGLVAADRYRLVFELKQPGVPSLDTRTEAGETVLWLRIAPADAAAVEAAMARIRNDPGTDRPGLDAVADRVGSRFTVVIDPGHGGVDLGAVGQGGTLEKELNLDFAFALRDALAKEEDVEILLTRTSDVFIPLAERSAVARRAGADLFISLHADSIRHRDLRGATVYTLSDKASDNLSREIAESENSSDRFAGPEWTQDAPEIHDILVDLVRRETESFSRHFAATLILHLGQHEIRLINNPRRSAGFRVLRAPDVPSVLLEIGYLSNKEDEKLLKTDEWQANGADAIASAVVEFLRSRSAIAEISER